jgi:hypothetical protein
MLDIALDKEVEARHILCQAIRVDIKDISDKVLSELNAKPHQRPLSFLQI